MCDKFKFGDRVISSMKNGHFVGKRNGDIATFVRYESSGDLDCFVRYDANPTEEMRTMSWELGFANDYLEIRRLYAKIHEMEMRR